ncbi:hypothetical protein [Pectinatus haikarae]|uniref:FeoB-associated Cys-rich membrane protein n=1 Tax=Pectinatus haikarae TaxID=349096 RepID=A0ABT9Y5B1_9FIRM|nr:hypothetical protein [Pectinatus haikarae]MDQ0202741.1 hypothetical protein [Pectinatus haikarae]
MTLTGTISTYVISALLLAAFLYGLYHIYRNFFKGESSCCSEGKSSSCGCCSCHEEKADHKTV